MSDNNKILRRYAIIVLFMLVLVGFVIVKAAVTMTKERDHWLNVKGIYVKEYEEIPADRGNILSADGKLLASSLPQYQIYMDYKSNFELKKDSFFKHIDEVSKGLNRILPLKSTNYFKRTLVNGLNAKKRSGFSPLYPYRITYLQKQEILKLPVFDLGKNKSGFIAIENNARKKPFGSLASRTIGELYYDKNKGPKNGVELAFNKYLSGEKGHAHKEKIKKRFVPVTDKEPIHGSDVIMALDVNIQDITEKALLDELKKGNAEIGMVMVMEVSTGDVKAIVNMTRTKSGTYKEIKNSILLDLYEPGSTMKTAAILTALNDNKIKRSDKQYLGNGIKQFSKHATLRDHNYGKGGFPNSLKTQNIDQIMQHSSNIGVAMTIHQAYNTKIEEQRFIEKLRDLTGMDLNLQLEGTPQAVIRDTLDNSYSKTTVPWMSFGYGLQVPLVNMITFYNAIANNGIMVKPRFVQAISKEGNVTKTFPVEILNKEIAKPKAIKDIQEILEIVVHGGETSTGKNAKSDQFKSAGKTGTAQLTQGAQGYQGGRQHLKSFIGYFPANQPKYTILVSIKTARGSNPYLPGSDCPVVFKEIAERIYAMKLKKYFDVSIAKDSINPLPPEVKRGLTQPSLAILKELDINAEGISKQDKATWSSFEKQESHIIIQNSDLASERVPSVYGMGARDAIYALESIGLNVQVRGKGKVYRQSITSGSSFRKGTSITLDLK